MSNNNDQPQTAIANTEDVKEHPVEDASNVNKRRKIVSENDDESLAMNVDGNRGGCTMEDLNSDNVNAMTEPLSNTEPPSITGTTSITEPPSL
ncbi:unnamed protein product [Rhizophagus irregularis]|nr:unnamed protein product [Rhizophagus irregularis]